MKITKDELRDMIRRERRARKRNGLSLVDAFHAGRIALLQELLYRPVLKKLK